MTESILLKLIPKTITINSIDFRSNIPSKTKTAFIHLADFKDGDEVVRILRGYPINGQNLYARRDLYDSSNNTIESNVLHEYVPTGKTRSYSRCRSFSRSPSPVPRFHTPPYHFPPPPTISYQGIELIQLHLSPLPLSYPETAIRILLRDILNDHFKSRGTMRLIKGTHYGTAFVSIYNLSNEPSLILMEKISQIVIEGHRIDISFQRNPRTPTYEERQELDNQMKYRSYSITADTASENILQIESPEMIKLHVSRLPLSTSENIIRAHLDIVLQKAFNSSPFSVVIYSTAFNKCAIADVINRSGCSADYVLTQLPQFPLELPEGVCELKFALQKGSYTRDTYVSNGVKNLPCDSREFRDLDEGRFAGNFFRLGTLFSNGR